MPLDIPKMRQVLLHGEYDISDEVYFSDPCCTPSMSASMAKDFTFGTPLHAWTNSSRLNPYYRTKNSTTFDIGDAFHSWMLSKGAEVDIIDADDWRSAAAKEARKVSYDMGRTPLLRDQAERVEDMVTAARIQLRAHSCGDPFIGTDAEITLIWERDGVWNRAKVDQIDRENRVLYDLKTCAGYAEPASWLQTNLKLGIDIRVAHYLDGANAVFGGDWRYRVVPVEKEPPHGLSVLELHPNTAVIGSKKLTRARTMLNRCLESNSWPGYPAEICQPDHPPWFESSWLERELAEADLKSTTGKDILDFAFQMQAPAPQQ